MPTGAPVAACHNLEKANTAILSTAQRMAGPDAQHTAGPDKACWEESAAVVEVVVLRNRPA
jgi:hypothetical protein